MDDVQLLKQYVKDGSQEAFAGIVRRHVDLVYGTARRLVGDEDLAQDVAQAAFLVLAQKAKQVEPRRLAGWLVNATRLAAHEARRGKLSREKHEWRAAQMRSSKGGEDASGDEPTLEQLTPLLDEALCRLGEADRTAVAMRFLQGRSFAEVAAAMGSSEEAARKRVERAVEKLRGMFMKKGFAPSVGGLMVVLAAHQAQAAPAGLAGSISATAISGGAGTSAILAKGAMKMMVIAKVKVAAVVAITVLGLGGASVALVVAQSGIPTTQATGVAPNAASAPGQSATAPGSFALTGTVTDVDDKPVSGAVVRCYREDRGKATLETETRTDTLGRFSLSRLPAKQPRDSAYRVLVIDHPDFAYDLVNTDVGGGLFDGDGAVRAKLMKPASIGGIVTDEAGNPVSGATVGASLLLDTPAHRNDWLQFSERFGLAVTSDSQGRFLMSRFPEGARGNVFASHPDFAKYRSERWETSTELFLRTGDTEVPVVLPRQALVHAKLVRDGVPYRKAGIDITAAREYSSSDSVAATATTDANGEAVLKGLGRGRYRVTQVCSTSPDVTDLVLAGTFSLTEGENQIQLSCQAGRLVSGRVVGLGKMRNGENAGHAVTAYRAGGEEGGPVAERLVGSEERFTLCLLPGEYTLRTAGWGEGGVLPVQKRLVVPADRDPDPVELEIAVPPLVKGQVVDEAGRPFVGTIVVGDQAGVTKSGPDGTFAETPWIRAADWHAGFALDATGKVGCTFAVPRGTDIEPLRVVARPTASVRARLRTPDGSPVPDDATLRLEVTLPDGQSMWAGGERDWKASLSREGELEIGRVFLGLPARVVIQTPGYIAVVPLPLLQPGSVKDMGDISLKPNNANDGRPKGTNTLSGRVVDENGQAVPGASVQASPMGDPKDTTDREGRFFLRNLSDGPTDILVHHGGYGFKLIEAVRAAREDIQVQITPQGYEWYGKTAPELCVSDWANGGLLELADLRGKVVLLYIGFTIIHQPLHLRMDYKAIDVVRRYEDRGLATVGVYCEYHSRDFDDRDMLDRFVSEEKIRFPIAIDAPRESVAASLPANGVRTATAAIYGAIGMPALYLIDKKGLVRCSPSPANLDEWVQKLLAEE